jgi:hypothetical protein
VEKGNDNAPLGGHELVLEVLWYEWRGMSTLRGQGKPDIEQRGEKRKTDLRLLLENAHLVARLLRLRPEGVFDVVPRLLHEPVRRKVSLKGEQQKRDDDEHPPNTPVKPSLVRVARELFYLVEGERSELLLTLAVVELGTNSLKLTGRLDLLSLELDDDLRRGSSAVIGEHTAYAPS